MAEGVGKTPRRFAGYRCRDLTTALANVEAALDEGEFDDAFE